MACTRGTDERERRQNRVHKVVWGVFFIAAGTLLWLNNVGRIALLPPPYPASNAVDGNPTTRWASQFHHVPEWITVDLDRPTDINRIRINWEAAYAKQYEIEVSDDNTTWTTVKQVTDGRGGLEEHDVSARGRYVRLVGTRRATHYGFSLWELEVYGPSGLLSEGHRVTASSLEKPMLWALFWSVILFVAGITPLVAPKDTAQQVMGLAMTGVGGFFSLQTLGLISWDFGRAWPVLLVVAGAMILLQSVRSDKGPDPQGNDESGNAGSPQ